MDADARQSLPAHSGSRMSGSIPSPSEGHKPFVEKGNNNSYAGVACRSAMVHGSRERGRQGSRRRVFQFPDASCVAQDDDRPPGGRAEAPERALTNNALK